MGETGIQWLPSDHSTDAPRDVEGIWRVAPHFQPSGFSAERRDHLTEIERSHFWFPPRRDLLARLLEEQLPAEPARILELGCGTGEFLASLVESDPLTPHPIECAVGVEGHPASLERARDRSTRPIWIHGDASALPLADAQFDVVVALDVLEHVEPKAFLREAHRLLRPGGAILLSVPAFPSLWSGLDEAAGHRKRYRIADLTEECAAAGLRIKGHTHYQCLLFPLVWMSRRWTRASGAVSKPSSRPMPFERRPRAGVGRALLEINRFEVRAFAGRTLPFGSSLMAWGHKSGK